MVQSTALAVVTAITPEPKSTKATVAPAPQRKRTRTKKNEKSLPPSVLARRKHPSLSRAVINSIGGSQKERKDKFRRCELCESTRTSKARRKGTKLTGEEYSWVDIWY